jgi:hypothetical protein
MTSEKLIVEQERARESIPLGSEAMSREIFEWGEHWYTNAYIGREWARDIAATVWGNGSPGRLQDKPSRTR